MKPFEDRSGLPFAVERRKMGDESVGQGGPQSELRSGLIDEACSRFEAAWQTGQQPQIEEFLPTASPDTSDRALLNLLVQLVGIDLEWRWKTAGAFAETQSVAKEPAGIDGREASDTLTPGRAIRFQVQCRCAQPSRNTCDHAQVVSQDGATAQDVACAEICAPAPALSAPSFAPTPATSSRPAKPGRPGS